MITISDSYVVTVLKQEPVDACSEVSPSDFNGTSSQVSMDRMAALCPNPIPCHMYQFSHAMEAHDASYGRECNRKESLR